jgi:hypothetical protein
MTQQTKDQKEWRPQKGDSFYYIDENNEVVGTVYWPDMDYVKHIKVFKTWDEAQMNKDQKKQEFFERFVKNISDGRYNHQLLDDTKDAGLTWQWIETALSEAYEQGRADVASELLERLDTYDIMDLLQIHGILSDLATPDETN